MKKITATFTLFLLFSLVPFSFAATVTYNDFSNLSAFSLNGSSAGATNSSGQSVLRLTNALWQNSSAFLTNPISLNDNYSFSAFFAFQITNPMGSSDVDGQGADGITFTIQTQSDTAGGSGGGIGYQGITPSLAIEYDTWNNGSWDDSDGNHVGVDLNGNVNSVIQYNVSTSRLNDGSIWYSWIDYNGSTNFLEIRLSQNTARPEDAIIEYTTDLTTIFSTYDAFIGFTSGTGAAGGYHDILSLSFTDTYDPISTPVPGTLALLGSGLLGLAAAKEKKLTGLRESKR